MAEATLSSAVTDVERERIHNLWQEKLAADPWAGWRALLNGTKIDGVRVPADPNTPFTGYYRSKRKDKTFAPVAYWQQDGKWICLIDGRQIPEDKAIESWPFISRYPISHEWYVAVAEKGEPWPDADERVSSQSLSEAPYTQNREVIGGNNPPEETPLQIAANKIANAKGGLDDYKVIEDDATLARAKSLKNRLTELAGEADKERKVQKEPHKLAADIIDEAWMPLVKDAQAAAKTLNNAMDIYATKKLQAQRAAEAEVQRQKDEAERIERENARKLAEAEDAGKPAPELEKAPEIKSAPTADVAGATIRPGYGRAASIKTHWVVTKITDIDALFAILKTHPELKTKMLELAQRAKDAGIDPPGCEVEERAKVRG